MKEVMESRGRVCFVTYACRQKMRLARTSCKSMQARTREPWARNEESMESPEGMRMEVPV